MAEIALIAPTDADLQHIANHLRAADRLELTATHGDDLDVLAALWVAVRSSDEVHVAVTAWGEPIAVFGVAPVSLLGGIGCPWMLGTDAMSGFARAVVTLSRAHVARWGLRYPLQFNYVDARNRQSIAWLRRTGFSIQPAAPYGLAGEPFHRFERCM